MPRYDYHCPANGKTLEVNHSMVERVETWQQLATLAGIEPGDTPPDSPVERQFGIPMILGIQAGSGGRCDSGGFS